MSMILICILSETDKTMPLVRQTEENTSINLTPMIDILFLLIIFFVVGTKFTDNERPFDVELPTVSEAPPLTSPPQELIVNISREGTLVLQGETLTDTELGQRLNEASVQYADQAVLIRGDQEIRYQRIAEILAICKQSGIQRISLGTRVRPANN